MADRLFLYIDILGFKDMIQSGAEIADLYKTIDELNVHNDKDFTCIVFSDTFLVYGAEFWLKSLSNGIMWLAEFAQDLFFRLISRDIHFRAYITQGDFEHYQLKNLEAYYGEALVNCYEREKEIKCTGVFIDTKLVTQCDIFKTTPFNKDAHYLHVMQNLDMISLPYDMYPLSPLGEYILSTGMESWIAYQLYYLQKVYLYSHDPKLSEAVRLKFKNTWLMLSTHHDGLTRRILEENFDFQKVVNLNWSDHLNKIGTDEGVFG